MIAYYSPNNGFTASDALFIRTKLASYTTLAESFQLIIYAIIEINIRSTTIPLYKFAAKQPKKEHKLGVKFFLEKLSTSREGPVKSTETRKG